MHPALLWQRLTNMQKYHLVLTFPGRDIESVKQKFSGNEQIQWLYLGKDFFKRRILEQKLGSKFQRLDTAKLNDEVARSIRHEHVLWVDDLNRLYGNDLEWWFGSISSRNPYSSDLFQYCCYLEMLERLWATGKRPQLIVIESIGLARTISNWADKKNIAADIVNYDHAKPDALANKLSLFLQWGNFAIRLMLRWAASYFAGKKFAKKRIGSGQYLLVSTFVHGSSLSEEGDFNDRYFPHLHEYILKKGNKVLVHPILSGFNNNFFSIYLKMRKSKTHFILQEDFLHFSDYIAVLAYPIKAHAQKIKANKFRDFDLNDLISEQQREKTFIPGMEAMLIYRLFLRLGRSGLQQKLIISWYENQVIDRGLIAGARKAFPLSKIIGAQMFIHSPNFINLYPSQSEADAKMVPHLLLETSKYQCQIAQAFTRTIPCRPAAALRYSHVFNNMNENSNAEKILVLLSFSIEEGVELLGTLKEALGQISTKIPILIKGHPDYKPDELIRAFGKNNWLSRFEIFNGSLPEALGHASMVVVSNSGSMVEAAARGIPVIFLGRQIGLNQNILSSLKIENMDIVTECFSERELVEAIEKYQNLTQAEKIRYKEIGKRVRDLFFEPVNEESLLPFLDIEKEE